MKIGMACVAAVFFAALGACGGDESGSGGSGGGASTTAASTTDAAATTTTTASSATTATTSTTGAGGGGGEGGGEPFVSPCFGFPLANAADACEPTAVGPLPGEESHWAAERLAPPVYPFTVTTIRYALLQGDDCRNDLAHQVDVFTGSAITPDPSPTVIAHFDVPAAAGFDGFLVFDHELPAPIVLQSGEFLWVSVQFAGVSPAASCIGACEGASVVADHSYWSNAGAPPFPWATIESFTLFDNYMVCADGTP